MPRPIPLLLRRIVRSNDRVETLIRGEGRPVVRRARLRGLICEVEDVPSHPDFECKPILSGQLAILRHAPLDGRLLVEILPSCRTVIDFD